MNELVEEHAPEGAGGAHNQGAEPKSRPIYDKSASEATRELRDTSRRRRAAEEKLQQHLLQAKDHVPHHYGHDAAPQGEFQQGEFQEKEDSAGHAG
ncbi:MAG: hypothetical protein WAL27_09225 [Cellulosimicrobium cellulans]